jgi:hypothetical protein
MSGTVRWKLHGSLMLGLALALASAGCIGSPGEPVDGDDDVADAVQDLDSTDSPGGNDAEEGEDEEAGATEDAGDEAGAVDPGTEGEDPQPQPWIIHLPGDPDPAPDPGPVMDDSSGTPSSGNGGK